MTKLRHERQTLLGRIETLLAGLGLVLLAIVMVARIRASGYDMDAAHWKIGATADEVFANVSHAERVDCRWRDARPVDNGEREFRRPAGKNGPALPESCELKYPTFDFVSREASLTFDAKGRLSDVKTSSSD